MRRQLLPSSACVRTARRLAKKKPTVAGDLQAALALLGEDAFLPALKTHKLRAKLARSWACSAGYDLRIVFQLVMHEGHEAILLEAAGTHDEVY